MVKLFYGQNRFFEFSGIFKAAEWSELADNFEKLSKMFLLGRNYWFGEICEKKFKNFSDFGVVTDFQIENFHGSGTWRHFLWHDSDGPSQDLQFEPYDDFWVALGKKLLRNYEKFMTKS